MKKRLEAELISIAHRILKLKGKEDLLQLHLETQKLYEALSVLKFVEINYNLIEPKVDVNEIEENVTNFLDKTKLPNLIFEPIAVEEKPVAFESIFDADYKEPVFEKIETLKYEIEITEAEIEHIEAEIETIENAIEEEEVEQEVSIGNHYIKETNDKPTGFFNINLNDKIGFVQQLFDNNNEDYNRVLSQLSTFDSFVDTKDFITNMVKPDYNDWKGKEDFEERFMAIIEQKFV